MENKSQSTPGVDVGSKDDIAAAESLLKKFLDQVYTDNISFKI